MSAATTTAILGAVAVAGASAGSQIYASHAQGVAADKSTAAQLTGQREAITAQTLAADKAADIEKAAADRAYQTQIETRNYDRDAARLAREDYIRRTSPYVQMGDSAFGRLADLLHVSRGTPGPSFGAPGGAPGQFGAPPPSTPQSAGVPQAPLMAPPQSMTAPGASLASLGTPATQATAPATMGVRMIAPTGEIGIVPYDKVGAVLAAGGKRATA